MPMTNSRTKSSSNESIEQILSNYLDGKITLPYLQEVLQGLISIDFSLAPEIREIKEINLEDKIKIPVKVEHLCRILKRYMSGNQTELDVSNWAAFIFMMPFYVPEGDTEEERWQAGEGPLWEILQELVTPSIFGGPNMDAVHKYLELLSCNV